MLCIYIFLPYDYVTLLLPLYSHTMATSLLFKLDEWDNTFCDIKSQLFCPEPPVQQNTIFQPPKDKKCNLIAKLLQKYFLTLCKNRTGRLMLRKVVHEGLSILSVAPLASTATSCCVTGRNTGLVVFRLRTCRRQRSNGVIHMNESRPYVVTREWLTCIQSILICSRLQSFIKHYAGLDIKQQITFKQRMAMRLKVNGAISYMVTVFSTIVTSDQHRSKLLSLLVD